MSEVIENGEAEKVVSKPAFGNSWYISHHGVYSNQQPDKDYCLYVTLIEPDQEAIYIIACSRCFVTHVWNMSCVDYA